MHSTGLPVPIGGSESLSAMLLELNSQGLRLANVPISTQTRSSDFSGSEFLSSQVNNPRPNFSQPSIVHTKIDHTPSSNASFGTRNSGLSALIPNILIHNPSRNMQKFQPAALNGEQQQKNQSTNFDQQKHQTNFQLILDSVKSSLDQKNTKNQNDRQHIQLAENQGRLGAQKHQKQLVSPKPPLYPRVARACQNLPRQMEKNKLNPEKRPLVEQQIEGKVLSEKSGVDSAYKPGRGVERLNQYMSQLKNIPKDNNIQFWRNLVAKFFAPNAKIRWCVSSCRNVKQISNLFKAPWQCNMCNVQPCCGFEIKEELLPRLQKIKYDVGILEEHLHIGTPNEYQGSCNRIFLHYSKAAEESEYEHAQIIRNGQLRIYSWEFCVQHCEEYIRRNSMSPQVSQLGAAQQNYRLSAQDSSSETPEELQKHTDTFISSAYQMVEAPGTPFTSQTRVTKRYGRCLEISQMLNIMHDLIDYSQESGLSPTESIAKFPYFGSNRNVSYGQKFCQQPEQQQSPAAPSAPYLEPFASLAPTNHKKQRPDSTCAQITSVGFTTPSFGVQPYDGPGSTNSINAQIKSFGSTTPSFSIQSYAGLRSPNSINVPVNSSCCDNSGTSKGIAYIDAENYELGKNATDFSVGTSSSAQVDVLAKDAKSNDQAPGYDDLIFNELLDLEDLQELLK